MELIDKLKTSEYFLSQNAKVQQLLLSDFRSLPPDEQEIMVGSLDFYEDYDRAMRHTINDLKEHFANELADNLLNLKRAEKDARTEEESLQRGSESEETKVLLSQL